MNDPYKKQKSTYDFSALGFIVVTVIILICAIINVLK